ncbi:hypothetical protein AX15_005857 [Amanita polypyramis BW_CC]|nr:hypothetical protein AX15_005857 [Amanita polypyramis BW_CC]
MFGAYTVPYLRLITISYFPPFCRKMAHDTNVYKSPWSFDPTRFIKTEDHEPEPDPRNICFGFGRRICPGRILTDVSIFISCAMTLAVFNITPYTKDGKPVIPDLEQTTGVLSHPSKFKYNITPRSQKVLALVNAAVEQRSLQMD